MISQIPVRFFKQPQEPRVASATQLPQIPNSSILNVQQAKNPKTYSV